MFSLPGKLTSSPALQRPGSFLNYVNDICTELCDTIQSNVTRFYEEFTNCPVKENHSAAAVYELKRLVKKRKKRTWIY